MASLVCILSLGFIWVGCMLARLDLLHYGWGWRKTIPTLGGAITCLGVGIAGLMRLIGIGF